MYKASKSEPRMPMPPPTRRKQADENVVDADFEEVDDNKKGRRLTHIGLMVQKRVGLLSASGM